jgi:hypothetical protein
MVQHGAALCQLWRVQMAENAQKVPEFSHVRAQRDASRTAAPGADMASGAMR